MLGGGIVPGSIVLVGGDPGIGKSTLLLQMAMEVAPLGKVLYVSGEESVRQIKMRALRLMRNGREAAEPSPNLLLLTETNLDTILQHTAEVNPTFLIIDSIQTVYLPEMTSSAGSVGQVRECASRLRELAKSSGMAVFLVGHVTKEGVIAGPRVLEHIVDTVLYLEGDRFQSYRLLRAVKNRFGATAEVGVFEMRERRHDRGHQSLRGIPGRAHGERARQRHRGDHGRHTSAAGGDAGADQPLQPGQPAPHPQRGGFQPPAARHRRSHAPGGVEDLRRGCVRQRGRGAAHRRTGSRPGGCGSHRLLMSRICR